MKTHLNIFDPQMKKSYSGISKYISQKLMKRAFLTEIIGMKEAIGQENPLGNY
jgi:hypothetical protein